MTLKKTKENSRFFWVFWKKLLLEVRQKTKKTQVFLLVFGQISRKTCNKQSMQKNKKDLSFFWFFASTFTVKFLSKKPKKTLSFFSFFQGSWPKKKPKKLEENQKKNKHEPQTKHSLKSFGFLGFLVFLDVFLEGRVSSFDFSPRREVAWENQKTSRKPKNQKKQNFSENVWSEAHVWFFFWFSSSFFCFFWSWPWKKLKKLKVFLVFWRNSYLK